MLKAMMLMLKPPVPPWRAPLRPVLCHLRHRVPSPAEKAIGVDGAGGIKAILCTPNLIRKTLEMLIQPGKMIWTWCEILSFIVFHVIYNILENWKLSGSCLRDMAACSFFGSGLKIETAPRMIWVISSPKWHCRFPRWKVFRKTSEKHKKRTQPLCFPPIFFTCGVCGLDQKITGINFMGPWWASWNMELSAVKLSWTIHHHENHLVGGWPTPLKNMVSSVGVIIPFPILMEKY